MIVGQNLGTPVNTQQRPSKFSQTGFSRMTCTTSQKGILVLTHLHKWDHMSAMSFAPWATLRSATHFARNSAAGLQSSSELHLRFSLGSCPPTSQAERSFATLQFFYSGECPSLALLSTSFVFSKQLDARSPRWKVRLPDQSPCSRLKRLTKFGLGEPQRLAPRFKGSCLMASQVAKDRGRVRCKEPLTDIIPWHPQSICAVWTQRNLSACSLENIICHTSSFHYQNYQLKLGCASSIQSFLQRASWPCVIRSSTITSHSPLGPIFSKIIHCQYSTLRVPLRVQCASPVTQELILRQFDAQTCCKGWTSDGPKNEKPACLIRWSGPQNRGQRLRQQVSIATSGSQRVWTFAGHSSKSSHSQGWVCQCHTWGSFQESFTHANVQALAHALTCKAFLNSSVENCEVKDLFMCCHPKTHTGVCSTCWNHVFIQTVFSDSILWCTKPNELATTETEPATLHSIGAISACPNAWRSERVEGSERPALASSPGVEGLKKRVA